MTQLTRALNTIIKRFGAHRVEIEEVDYDYLLLTINGWQRVRIEYFAVGERSIQVWDEDWSFWHVDQAYADWLGAIIDGYVRNDSGHMVPGRVA